MKLKDLIPRIPRPVKACFCALLVLFAAIVYYIILGSPTLTFRQQFRRAEKANLVGPSTIVDTLGERTYSEFNKLIVGETEYGICFFGRYGSHVSGGHHSGERHYLFTYTEKTGDLTIASVPNITGSLWDMWEEYDLPVYIFTDHKDAVQAELTLVLHGQNTVTQDGEKVTTEYTETFQATGYLVEPGVLRCTLIADSKQRCNALYMISEISSGKRIIPDDAENSDIAAIVCLYDQNGNVIATKSLDILP